MSHSGVEPPYIYIPLASKPHRSGFAYPSACTLSCLLMLSLMRMLGGGGGGPFSIIFFPTPLGSDGFFYFYFVKSAGNQHLLDTFRVMKS